MTNKAVKAQIGMRALIAIVCLALFACLSATVTSGGMESFDAAGLAAVHSIAQPPLTAFMRMVTSLADPYLLWIASIAMVVVFSLQKAWRASGLVAGTMLGSWAMNDGLKAMFHRHRPVPYFDPAPHSFSYPSGHAMLSICFYGLIAMLILQSVQPVFSRRIVWSVAVVLMVLIGFSRVYLGVHFPSDVIGGYLCGIFWMLTLSALRLAATANVSAIDREPDPT